MIPNKYWMSVFVGFVVTLLAIHAKADVTTYFTVSDDSSHSVETWSLANSHLGNSTNGSNLAVGGNVYNYVVEYFTPTTSGTYKMGQISANVDTVMLIYENSFDPASPATNFLAFNDDGNQSYFPTTPSCRGSSGLCPAFQTNLTADTDYYIVISTYSPGSALSLPQEFFVTGIASVGVGGEPPADPDPDPDPLVLDGNGSGEDEDIDLDNHQNEVRFDDDDDVDANLSFDSDTEFDTQDNDGTVSGGLSGDGRLIKTGSGTLTLTGTNTQAGTTIQEGTVVASSDGALGDASSDLELDGGTLQAGSDFTIGRNIEVSANNGAINTNGQEVVASGNISGNGKLIKLGAGSLTLSGNNSYTGTLIREGVLIASSDTSLGNVASSLELDGGTLQAGTDFTIGRDIEISASDGTINTNGQEITASGNVSGAGCLIKDGNGKLIATGLIANSLGACVRQGILALNGSITGGAVVENNGILQGSGTIHGTITVNGTLAPGNSPGTITSVGSVVQGAASTLEVEVDGYGTGSGSGNYDRVLVTGASSTYTADGTLKPILRGMIGDASNTFTPEIGDKFEIVEAAGGIVGEYATLTQPGTGLADGTRFDIIYGDTVISLVVTPTSFTNLPNITLQGNASEAGKAIDQIRPSTGAAITNTNAKDLYDNLTQLDEANLNRALRQVSGESTANVMTIASQARAETTKVLANRLATKRHSFHTTKVSAQAAFSLAEESDDITKGLTNTILGLSEEGNIWGKLIGKYSRTGADSNAQGYSSKTFGVVLGGDIKVNSKLMAGLAFSNLNSEIDSSENGSGRVESWQVLSYGSYIPAKDYFIDGSLGVSFEKYRETRVVALANRDATAYGSSSGYSIIADVEAGKAFNTKYAVLEPYAGFKLDWMKQNSFKENGDQAIAMEYDANSLLAPQARLGLRTGKKFINNEKDYKLRGNVAWLRDIGTGYYGSSEARLHNTTVTAYPSKPGKNALELGTGVMFGKEDGLNFNLDYEAELRENRTSHGLAIGVKYSW